jgi:hypothetical protein
MVSILFPPLTSSPLDENLTIKTSFRPGIDREKRRSEVKRKKIDGKKEQKDRRENKRKNDSDRMNIK